MKPVPVQIVVFAHEMLSAQGEKYEDAKAHVTKHYPEPATRPIEAWSVLAALEERKGSSDAALNVLDQAAEHLKDTVDLPVGALG